jgi:hypothetical protein
MKRYRKGCIKRNPHAHEVYFRVNPCCPSLLVRQKAQPAAAPSAPGGFRNLLQSAKGGQIGYCRRPPLTGPPLMTDQQTSTHDATRDARNDDFLIHVDDEIVHRDATRVSV